MAPVLGCGPGLRARPVVESDRADLARILAEPSVAAWWTTHDLDGAITGTLGATVWTIEESIDGTDRVIGGAQAWANDDQEYEHAGIDLFLSGAAQGRGVGRLVVRAIAAWLFAEGHHRIVIDPAAANEAAIRCYAAVGFRPVGVMRAYERRPDGSWVDGLLMDLLPQDLTP